VAEIFSNAKKTSLKNFNARIVSREYCDWIRFNMHRGILVKLCFLLCMYHSSLALCQDLTEDFIAINNEYEHYNNHKIFHIEDSTIVKYSSESFENTFPASGTVYGKRNSESKYTKLKEFEALNIDSTPVVFVIDTEDFDSLIFTHDFDRYGFSGKYKESYPVEKNIPFTVELLKPSFGVFDGDYLRIEVYDKQSIQRTLFARMNDQPLYELNINDQAKPFRIRVKALDNSQDFIRVDSLGGNMYRVVFVHNKDVIERRRSELQQDKKTWLVPIGIKVYDPLRENDEFENRNYYLLRQDVRKKGK